MGYSILELVLQRLRESGFTADVAYPGQKFPRITEPVATVHIDKVDRTNLLVTVEVSIICPAAMGGTACEVEALRATEVLRWAGAVCIQNGCTYDGVSQVYVVSVMATFTGVTEADSCVIGPGFQVYINDQVQPYAVAFSAWEEPEVLVEHAMGESVPIGAVRRSRAWNVRLEELIPAGSKETPPPEGLFELRVLSDHCEERYHRCVWGEYRREYTHQGLRRFRTAVAMERGELLDG